MKNKNTNRLVLGLLAITSLALISCRLTDDEQQEELNCIGEADPNTVCIEIFEPVCGCNGVTYSNSCHASAGGVLEWTDGECN